MSESSLPDLSIFCEGLKWDIYQDNVRGLVVGIMPQEGYEWAFGLPHPDNKRVNAWERKVARKDKDLILKTAYRLVEELKTPACVMKPKVRKVK